MTAPPPEFSRSVPLGRLGPAPFALEISATAEECAELAVRLGLIALDRLSARVVLERRADDTILLQGDLAADFTQECVVSLEPVPGTVAERFALLYGPAEAEASIADDSADSPAFQPLEGDAIDIGEAVAQEFSLSLPPFPRAPDAVIEIGETPDEAGPFAVLGRLKTGSGPP